MIQRSAVGKLIRYGWVSQPVPRRLKPSMTRGDWNLDSHIGEDGADAVSSASGAGSVKKAYTKRRTHSRKMAPCGVETIVVDLKDLLCSP